MQSTPLSGHNNYFRIGFAKGFESITKPQREVQNDQRECTVLTLSRFYSRFRNMHAQNVILVQTFGPEST